MFAELAEPNEVSADMLIFSVKYFHLRVYLQALSWWESDAQLPRSVPWLGKVRTQNANLLSNSSLQVRRKLGLDVW